MASVQRGVYLFAIIFLIFDVETVYLPLGGGDEIGRTNGFY